MKGVIAILVIAGVLYGAYALWDYYDQVNRIEVEQKAVQAQPVSPNSIPGLDWRLEDGLRKAQSEGLKSFRLWLEANRASILDPRLAWIELDYMLLLSKSDPIEAKKLFLQIQKRATRDIDTASPVHRRIKDLEPTYQ